MALSGRPCMKVAIAADTTSRREFAEEYGSPLCIVKLGCWGPVVQCNVGKRGWMGGIGGCPNVGGICIGCTMPGFPDKFMPFMNQPPGSLLSTTAVMTYGRAIHALRRFTQASLNKEPAWRRKDGVERNDQLNESSGTNMSSGAGVFQARIRAVPIRARRYSGAAQKRCRSGPRSRSCS